MADKERHQKSPEIVDEPRDDDDEDGDDNDDDGDGDAPHDGSSKIADKDDKKMEVIESKPRVGAETMKVTKH